MALLADGSVGLGCGQRGRSVRLTQIDRLQLAADGGSHAFPVRDQRCELGTGLEVNEDLQLGIVGKVGIGSLGDRGRQEAFLLGEVDPWLGREDMVQELPGISLFCEFLNMMIESVTA